MPVQLSFNGWDAGALGFYELQARCDAVLMGRTTFGAGRRLTPDLRTDTALTLIDARTWPGGVAELPYGVDRAR
jgi:hypothetical protein